MTVDEFVKSRVHTYYWHKDFNCATTTLKILAEHFNLSLQEQIFDAAIGMHGAGRFGAQCGLVEGALMFLGIYGRSRDVSEADIVEACFTFAEKFQTRFDSLNCNELRPEGFAPDNPPHMCTPLTADVIIFSLGYISRLWP